MTKLISQRAGGGLVHLRFDDAGAVQTCHVGVPSIGYAENVLWRAKERGLTPGAKLVEYAVFSSLRTIHPRQVPNFHFLTLEEFHEQTGGAPASPSRSGP
jgi:hypothetical protein